jgi:r-opsin
MGGRLSKPQAAILIVIAWFWALPFTIFPILEIWGHYIPGRLLPRSLFNLKFFLILFSEGFLTTCSFDYLSHDQDTKVFVAAIFTWAYAIPITLIVIFYAKLFMHVSTVATCNTSMNFN